MPEVLMVIAPEMFRDEEYAEPLAVLEARGARVTTASKSVGTCTGKLGMTAEASVTLADALSKRWAAVVFVGGAGSSVFFDDPDAHRLAQAARISGAVLSAICIAPSILARAGVLEHRRATSFPSQEDDLRAHGAFFTGNRVDADDRIVTANGPESATAFGTAIADAMKLPTQDSAEKR